MKQWPEIVPKIEVVIEISAPIERVFDLSRSIDVHQESQAHHREKSVAGRTTGMIGQGEEVTWEATHFGVRQRLTSRIVEMRRPSYFRDSLVKGAFRRFDHDHYFAQLPDGGTRVTDIFDFSSPFGVLGWLVDQLILTRYMRRLILERNLAIKRLAEAS